MEGSSSEHKRRNFNTEDIVSKSMFKFTAEYLMIRIATKRNRENTELNLPSYIEEWKDFFASGKAMKEICFFFHLKLTWKDKSVRKSLFLESTTQRAECY